VNRQNWAIIGSGASGHGLSSSDLADFIVLAVDTAIGRITYDLVDYHLTRHHPCYRTKEAYPTDVPSRIRVIGFPIVACRAWWWKKGIEGCAGPGVEVIDAPIPIKGHPFAWERGMYTAEREPIGPHAVQYAANNGAKRISIWGLEGDFVGAASLNGECEYQGRILQMIADACPDIEFQVHGELAYSLTGSNVHLVHG